MVKSLVAVEFSAFCRFTLVVNTTIIMKINEKLEHFMIFTMSFDDQCSLTTNLAHGIVHKTTIILSKNIIN